MTKEQVMEQELEDELEYELEFEAQMLEGQEAEIIGTDDRVRVPDTTAAPFRYICNVERDPSGGVAFPNAGGTGVLIGPSTMLTAGHIVRRGGADSSKQMRIIPGRNRTLEPLPSARGLIGRVAPGFAVGTATDYGVVQLRQPIGIEVGYWNITHRLGFRDSIGTSISSGPLPVDAGKLKVNLSGYPRDKPTENKFGCRSAAGRKDECFRSQYGAPGRSQFCGTEQWRAYDRTVRIAGGLLEYLTDQCTGHSGSPVWVRRDASRGGRVMVAINIAHSLPPAKPVNMGARITPNVLNHIRHWLAQAPVPPPFRILDRFAFDKADLAPQHIPLIQEIARRIVARSSTPDRVRTVFLVGHADSRGSAAYNKTLGQKRAVAVHARLVMELERLRPGITRALKFSAMSMGEAQPLAPPTADGRARNRRVEVMLGRI